MDYKIKDKNLKLGHSLEIQWVFFFLTIKTGYIME